MGNLKMKHIVSIIIAIIGAVEIVAGAYISAKFGKESVVNVYVNGEEVALDNQAVQRMITENDDLKEQNDEYEKSIEELSSGYKDLDDESQNKDLVISELTEENESLKSQVEGLESENQSLKDNLTAQKDSGDQEEEDAQQVDAVEFSEVPDILYDGVGYKKYLNSDDKNFSVGGKTYYSGFSLEASVNGDGYVYFNLGGNFSKMKFDVGRNFRHDDGAMIMVTSSSGLHQEYNLDGNVPSQNIEIELENANDLTIKLICNAGWVGYGFFNIYYIP